MGEALPYLYEANPDWVGIIMRSCLAKAKRMSASKLS